MGNAGHNTNLASEFYVLSMLHRLGRDAHLTLGNKKSVDIVIVRERASPLTIDVKAVAGKFDWPASNVPDVAKNDHFVILLSYEGKFSDHSAAPRLWVLPHHRIVTLIKRAHPPSAMKYIPRKAVLALQEFEGAWTLLA